MISTQKELQQLSEMLGIDVTTADKFRAEANKLFFHYYREGMKNGLRLAREVQAEREKEKFKKEHPIKHFFKMLLDNDRATYNAGF